jgi:hypothetical protein
MATVCQSEDIEGYKKLRMQILRILLEHDVSDVDHLNYEEDNCLHAAISSGFPEAAMIVIDHLQQLEGNEKKPRGEHMSGNQPILS